MTAPVQQALCPSFIGAKRMRVTLVDGCGRPVYGPQSQVVSSGFVSVEIEPEVEDGDDQSQKTAGGENCVVAKGPSFIKWWNLSIEFCQVDPDLWLIMNRTWKPVTSADRSKRTGVRPTNEFSDQLGFALELWPKAAGGASAVCDPTQPGDEDFFVSGYFLLPWCLGEAPDTFTFENEPTTFTLKARARVGSLWGKGPYNVTRDAQNQPSRLLDYIDPGFDVPAWDYETSGIPDPMHIEVVTVKPPDAKCGAQELYNDDATPAQVAVDEGATTRTAALTITPWDQIKSGTVNWGDGTIESVPNSSGGEIHHEYKAELDGTEQTIQFNPGNGAKPVTVTFTPTAPPTVTGVTVTGPDTAQVGGQDVPLVASAKLSDNTDKTVTNQATWTSSDETIATVAKGLVHPVKVGTVQITAKYADHTSANHTVTVTPPAVTSLTLAPASSTHAPGEQQAYTVTGQPGDQDVTGDTTLTADPAGKVTITGQSVAVNDGAANGDVTITGTYGTGQNQVTSTATLTVKAPAPTSLTLAPATSSHAPGETQAYTATTNEGDDVTADTTFTAPPGSSVTFSGATATVGSGAAAGDVTVTGTYTTGGGDITGTATLTVTAALARNAVAPHPKAKRGVALTLDDAPAGDLTVDWGDGNTDQVTGAGPHQHTYTRDGNYTILVTDTAGQPVTSRNVSVPFTTADPHDGQ